jgi:hypothetical protein
MSKDDRAQLEAWIAGSQRFRRTLGIVMAVAAVIAFAVWLRWSLAGGIALLLVGAIYGSGLWITFGHITDWRARIEQLERRERARR